LSLLTGLSLFNTHFWDEPLAPTSYRHYAAVLCKTYFVILDISAVLTFLAHI